MDKNTLGVLIPELKSILNQYRDNISFYESRIFKCGSDIECFYLLGIKEGNVKSFQLLNEYIHKLICRTIILENKNNENKTNICSD